ncbi:MAG: CPBP family intramembrane glutamic endopeptidase [Desulfomonilaceae bacterium]|nr:CPBP family intramembrane glutamic endopeptidase [Desulfomonilaceae bacterium]
MRGRLRLFLMRPGTEHGSIQRGYEIVPIGVLACKPGARGKLRIDRNIRGEIYSKSLIKSLSSTCGARVERTIMSVPYLDLAREGKNDWWRYALGIWITVTLWLGVTTALFMALGAWTAIDGDPSTYVDPRAGKFVGIDPFVHYIILNLGHLAMLLGLFVSVRFIHKRRIRTLVTSARTINWRMVGLGFGLYGSLLIVLTLFDYARSPETYYMTRNPARVLMLAPIVLILTPIQTTTEELVFRGYVMQGAGLLFRRFGLPALISATVFTLPHLANPELVHGFWLVVLYYFGIGLLFALVTLRSNSLEAVIGAHASVNVFSALIVNYSDSALSTESFFFCSNVDAVDNIVLFIVMAVLFYVLLFNVNLAGKVGRSTRDAA